MTFKINSIPDKITATPYNLFIARFDLYNYKYNQEPTNNNKTDIRLIVSELNIYESIYSNFMEAEVLLDDAVGLFTNFPIIGDEMVHLEMQSPHNGFDGIRLKMRVVSLTELSRTDARVASYTLKLVSEESLRDVTIRLSRSYGPKECSEIVKDIFNGRNPDDPQRLKMDWSEKLLEVHDSEGQRQIAFPFMNPMKMINFLADETKEKAVDISNYYFYEDHDTFNFKNIDSLLKEDPVEVYWFTDVKNLKSETVSKSALGIKSDVPMEFCVLDSFKINSIFNFEEMLTNGYLASSLLAIDPDLQTLEYYQYQYGDDFMKFHHTSKLDKNINEIISPESSYFEQIDTKVNARNILSNLKHGGKYNIYPSQKETIFNKKLASDQMLKYIVAEMIVPRKYFKETSEKKLN